MCPLEDSSSDEGAAVFQSQEEQQEALAAQTLRDVSFLQNSIKFTIQVSKN